MYGRYCGLRVSILGTLLVSLEMGELMRLCISDVKNRLESSNKQVTLEPTMVWCGHANNGYYDGLAYRYLHAVGKVLRRID